MASPFSALRTEARPEQRYPRVGESSGEGPVAHGSYGKVYIARDAATGDIVAVKRQNVEHRAAVREYLFYRALRPTEHPHVMALRDAFTACSSDKRIFLYTVFDFMDSSFGQLAKHRQGVFSREEANLLFRSIAAGLVHLHASGVIHGDLSAGNILVSGNLRVNGTIECKIADMGSAFSAHSLVVSPAERITTAPVRSPEVILEAESITSATDIWALGVHAITLATGTRNSFWRPDGVVLAENSHVLSQQVRHLGPPTATAWPGLEGLPQFTAYATLFQDAVPTSLQASLRDPGLMQQPLQHKDDATILLLSALLRWDPAQRHSAVFAEKEPLFLAVSFSAQGDGVVRAGLPLEAPLPLEDETPKGAAKSEIGTGTFSRRATDAEGSRREKRLRTATSTPQLEDLRCTCRGNCGSRLCKRAQNRVLRRKPSSESNKTWICGSPASPGFAFCELCKCELTGCPNARNNSHGQMRWCSAHAKELACPPRHSYANRHGLHKFGQGWSDVLRLLARWAFLLELVAPDDLGALLELGETMSVAPGARLEPLQVVVFFFGPLDKVAPVLAVLCCRGRSQKTTDSGGVGRTPCRCVAFL